MMNSYKKNSNEDASALIDANFVPEVSNPHRRMAMAISELTGYFYGIKWGFLSTYNWYFGPQLQAVKEAFMFGKAQCP